mgnify:CR=1 FL=1
MTDYSEIILRLGADSKALFNGLERTGSWVKAWGKGIAMDLRGHFTSMFAGAIAFSGVQKLYDAAINKVELIRKAMIQTGLSAELIQGAFSKVSKSGGAPEDIIKPLTMVTTLGPNAKRTLADLAEAYVKLNTQEERNAMLKSLGIKKWETLLPLLEGGQAGIDKMSESSIWKYNDRQIADLLSFKEASASGGKKAGTIFGKFFATAFGAWQGLKAAAMSFDPMLIVFPTKEGIDHWMKKGEELRNKHTQEMLHKKDAANYAEAEAEAEKKGFTLVEKRLELEKNLTDELIKREKQVAKINDRSKFGVNELSERARQIMGDRMPHGLASIYTVTPAMASAARIKSLEEQAQVAQAYGNAGLADSLMSQADRMRENNPSLKSVEQFPLKDIQQNVATIDDNIKALTAKIAQIPTPP